MNSLLGIPLDQLLLGSAVLVLAGTAFLVLAAIRRPILLRLALRNSARRPAQACLITLGLTMSTVIVTTAFNTGDTITHTVRTLVASGLGRADEVVLSVPREQFRNPGQTVGALLNGSLLTGAGRYFPESRAAELAAVVADEPRLAGLTAAIGEQVTVLNLDLQAVQGQVSVLALPPEYPPVFGGLIAEDDGRPLALSELAPGQVYANVDAARQLGLAGGTRLELRLRDGALEVGVRAVVLGGDLGGSQPTLYFQLADYQRLINRPGSINQILIANSGEATSSVLASAEVARALRLALANRPNAEALFNLLQSPTARDEISALARTVQGRPRDNLERLSAALNRPAMDDDFVNLIGDVEIERRLLALAGRLHPGGGIGASSYAELASLRVVEVKQVSQDLADRWGGALTSTFLVLGLFSLATGALLIALIFMTLAAERRGELGVARALGARRGDVIVAFLIEGALYDLLGSLLGLALGVLLALGIAAQAQASLVAYGIQLQPRLEPRSLLLAYLLGLLLTYISIGCSAWHVSRLSIVAAIRDLPDPANPAHRGWVRLLPLTTLPVGPLLFWLGLNQRWPLAQAVGIATTLLSLAPLLRRALSPAEQRDRLAYSACGCFLLAYWLLPADWPLLATLRPPPRGVDLFFLAGCSIVLGAVLVLIYNLPALTRPLVYATAGLRSLGLALRTATANPLQHRLRSGMIVAMFALVIFSMVVAGVLLTATHRAYSDPEALAGGFDLRADLNDPNDPVDLPAELASTRSVRAADFVGLGRLATRPGQIIELTTGTQRWRPYPLQELDAGFANGLHSPLATRAQGFESDAAVWAAVLSDGDYAVVGGAAVAARGPDSAPAPAFQFSRPLQNSNRFQPVSIWARDARGGAPRQLRVVGVLDPRVSFAEAIFVRAGTFAPTGAPGPAQTAYYLKARAGADPAALALGLNISLESRGLKATALGEEVRRIQSVRVLLNQLLEGFFGIGLFAGLAALGVISMRAVVERRQQIGVLRALGFRRQMVRLSLLLEISLLALLGIGLGVGLGLALAQRLIEYLGRQYSELVFAIPWDQIALIALATYLAAIALAALPLWQIGRIQPADALKHQ
jgi:putative ABC transport system permease protein